MRAFTVAQLAGIDIVVHRLWALWFVGLAAVLAQVTFPEMIRGWSAPAYWVLAVAVVLGENAGGLVHELGHALMALAHRRHVHSITLYGFAAATRRTTCPSDAREQFLVALAGPLSHLLLAAGFCALF